MGLFNYTGDNLLAALVEQAGIGESRGSETFI